MEHMYICTTSTSKEIFLSSPNIHSYQIKSTTDVRKPLTNHYMVTMPPNPNKLTSIASRQEGVNKNNPPERFEAKILPS
eukprot:scaffold6730_cov66-Cyclotella_meneghiniana.AAC.7